MGCADAGAAVGGSTDDDGAIDFATGHVADHGGVVDDLIPGDGVEAPEHEFHDGANAEHGGADSHADETGLADGGIDDTVITPFVPKAFGDFVGTVVLGDFLTHQDDHGIAGEFLIEGFAEGVAVGEAAGHIRRGKESGKRGLGAVRLGQSIVEEVASGLAGVGLIVDFPVNVFEDGFGGGIGAGFGKVAGSFGFFLGFLVDFFQVFLRGDAFFNEDAFPALDGVVLIFEAFDFFLGAVFFFVGVGDGVAFPAVGGDFEDGGAGKRVGAFDGHLGPGADFVNILAGEKFPIHIVACGAFGEAGRIG